MKLLQKSRKKGNVKISKVKQNNQMKKKIKQGTIKLSKGRMEQITSKKKTMLLKKKQQNVAEPKKKEEEETKDIDTDIGEDVLDMVDGDDLIFLKKAISDKSYSLLSKIRLNREKMKEDENPEDNEMETEDDDEAEDPQEEKGRRALLPTKTKAGLQLRYADDTDDSDDESEEGEEDGDHEDGEGSEDHEGSEEDGEDDEDGEEPDENEKDEFKTVDMEPLEPMSTVELFACREEVLRQKKFLIGHLASSILEEPEQKCNRLPKLLSFMDEENPEVLITVRKLATISALEVFKDILPNYKIYHPESLKGIRLKKATKKLHLYEDNILLSYKRYLQKLEQMVSICRRKKKYSRPKEHDKKLGVVALHCLCDLLVSNPYFNYALNILQLVVPFLNSRLSVVRGIITKAIRELFRTDKRGEMTWEAVRRINNIVKKNDANVQPEVIDVFLALRIKDVNLDKEKEDEMKRKKFMTITEKYRYMSRRERKRSKMLEKVEKEMLSTVAEENKQKKHHHHTEVMKVVFVIYFKILKKYPTSRVMSSVLEGLAKFAHCINLDFFQDLVQVMNGLIEEGVLSYRDELHCVQTVFTILSGQGDVLNIDPMRFYAHLYRNLYHVHAGRTHNDISIIIHTLNSVLIKRRKKISIQRVLAFTKRLGTLSTQLLPHGSLACLAVMKIILQAHKSADMLLDADCTVGDGFFLPELEEPEYCNAGNSALWEMSLLQKHYHPVVKKYARYIASGVPSSGEGSLPIELVKLSPAEIMEKYDSSQMDFNPAIPAPNSRGTKGKTMKLNFKDEMFQRSLDEVLSEDIGEQFDLCTGR